MSREAHVLVTLTEFGDGDVRVDILRVGGTENGWAVELVGGMLAGPDDAVVESVRVDGLGAVVAGEVE